MLLAIDAGNSHTVFGLFDGQSWVSVWRRHTNPDETEDELAAWLRSLFQAKGYEWKVDAVICASVAPALNSSLEALSSRWFGAPAKFLKGGSAVGLKVEYQPETSVGADRLANALGALEKFKPPLIVVDFGTGTNFDVVDERGAYIGGAIMPGVLVGSEALFKKAAKLPHVDGINLQPPKKAIGRSTVESLQSGIVLGYAAAIDGLVRRMRHELGAQCPVIATGGLGAMFMGTCETVQTFEPNLTLDGLRVAHARLS